MVAVFREVWRVLRKDGTCWVNIGDSYTSGNSGQRVRDSSSGGLGGPHVRQTFLQPSSTANPGRPPLSGAKPKDLCLIPERLAIALQDAGWYVRSRIAWCKRAPMPESVTDRPTSAWEHIWLLSKSERYYYDANAVREEAVKGAAGSTFIDGKTGINGNGRVSQKPREESAGRNMRNFWLLGPEPNSDHEQDLDAADYVGPGDIPYTASEDCLIHAPLVGRRKQQMVEGDEQLDLETLRNLDTDCRHALRQMLLRAANDYPYRPFKFAFGKFSAANV